MRAWKLSKTDKELKPSAKINFCLVKGKKKKPKQGTVSNV